MARHFVKQPDGKFALFSTVIDGFICYNATREEIIEFLVTEERDKITAMIDKSIIVAETGKSDFQAMTVDQWAYANEIHEANHGKLK